jgi:hypothetical protein
MILSGSELVTLTNSRQVPASADGALPRLPYWCVAVPLGDSDVCWPFYFHFMLEAPRPHEPRSDVGEPPNVSSWGSSTNFN